MHCGSDLKISVFREKKCAFNRKMPTLFVDEINSNTLPRRGKNTDVSRRSVSDADMNGRNTPPGRIEFLISDRSNMHHGCSYL